MSFRATHLKQLGGRVSVTLPLDEAGYVGRECPQPACLGYFKVKPGTGLTGPDLLCVCPYCGYKDSPRRFYTPAQIEYATSVAMRNVGETVRKDLKSMEFDHRPRGGFGIGISLKVKHGPPLSIKHYREEKLETELTCNECTLSYSVFGLFAYCPDCAVHNSLQILNNNLALTQKQLALAGGLDDPELQRHLIEDALENCVSAFDGFGRETCRVRANKSTDPSKCENVSFQNLNRAAARLQSLFNVDLRSIVPVAVWTVAHVGFMRRHVLAHKAGIIDQPYIDETNESPSLLGRRLTISADAVRELLDAVSALGKHLVDSLPPP
jgi:hypothetical protein